MTSEDLKNIFYSGYDAAPDWSLLDELDWLLKKNGLYCEIQEICGVKKYRKIADGVKGVEGPGPQSKAHMALKFIAQKFLKKKGKKSFTERYFLGAHPDVISTGEDWIVECGSTSPEVVLLFLGEPHVQRVAILPYPHTGEKKLRLHIFSRGPNFKRFVVSKSKWLRKVFDSAKNRKNF